MPSEHLTIVFDYGHPGVRAILDAIRMVLARHPVAGDALSLAKDMRRIESERRKHFNIASQGFEFDYGHIVKFKLSFLGIRLTAQPRFDWDEWVRSLVACPEFIMAWIVDTDYEHWQNAQDPLEYSAVGKPYTHLPMISNGLPYPLEQKIIDTSNNPGRRVLREGYIESVGATMWLGEPFWLRTGADKNTIINTKWLQITEAANSVTKIRAGENCFTTSEGPEGDRQRKLRSLLFPLSGMS